MKNFGKLSILCLLCLVFQVSGDGTCGDAKFFEGGCGSNGACNDKENGGHLWTCKSHWSTSGYGFKNPACGRDCQDIQQTAEAIKQMAGLRVPTVQDLFSNLIKRPNPI